MGSNEEWTSILLIRMCEREYVCDIVFMSDKTQSEGEICCYIHVDWNHLTHFDYMSLFLFHIKKLMNDRASFSYTCLGIDVNYNDRSVSCPEDKMKNISMEYEECCKNSI